MTRTVVVDGSNLATEGRPLPSLRQLQDAVASFREEHPDDQLIIVADATFGHRIEQSEVEEFDLLVDHGQITCPPAGAVGRGDAFVLSIANKAHATILSNDSFQEFHGSHPWLFDEGRLIGGKPVPHIGWVFVARTPVRGPISRKATQQAKRAKREPESRGNPAKVSKEAFQPMPVPRMPPPSRPRRNHLPAVATEVPAEVAFAEPHAGGLAPPARGESINDLLPFLEFVERHPVGTVVEATFDTYSSHGAYATGGGVRIYVPLRSMSAPAPRSAREMVKLGEVRQVVVSGFNAQRRGVDASFVEMAPASIAPTAVKRARGGATAPPTKARSPRKARSVDPMPPSIVPVETSVPSEPVTAKPVKRARGTRAAKAPATPVAVSAASPVAAVSAVPPAPVKKAVKKAATLAPAKRPAKKAVAAVPVKKAVAAAPVKKAAKKAAKKAPTPARKASPAPVKKAAKRATPTGRDVDSA